MLQLCKIWSHNSYNFFNLHRAYLFSTVWSYYIWKKNVLFWSQFIQNLYISYRDIYSGHCCLWKFSRFDSQTRRLKRWWCQWVAVDNIKLNETCTRQKTCLANRGGNRSDLFYSSHTIYLFFLYICMLQETQYVCVE